mgnify:CR=1 FL=1
MLSVSFSSFTKYDLSLPELLIDREDYTFASYLDGSYTTHNIVAYAENCDINGHIRACFIFDLSGN